MREDIVQVQNCGIPQTSRDTVEDAINLMTENDTTALIVVEGDRPAGIFTEKDILLSYVKFNRKPYAEIKLKNAMTSELPRPQGGAS